jgi:hypothetical protein
MLSHHEEDLKFIKLTEGRNTVLGNKIAKYYICIFLNRQIQRNELKTPNSSLPENTMHSHYKDKLSLSIPKNQVKCGQKTYKMLA